MGLDSDFEDDFDDDFDGDGWSDQPEPGMGQAGEPVDSSTGSQFNFSDAHGATDFGTGETKELEQSKSSIVKGFALTLAVIGAAIAVVVLGIRLFSNLKNADAPLSGIRDDNAVPTNLVDTVVGPVETMPVYVAPGNNNTDCGHSDVHGEWEWVLDDYDIQFDGGYIDGVFTVTEVNLSSLVAQEKSVVQLSSLVTGSLSGLPGAYEVELPFEVARRLTLGAELNVKYQICEVDGVRFVGDLKF